jgi:hypothetical protein
MKTKITWAFAPLIALALCFAGCSRGTEASQQLSQDDVNAIEAAGDTALDEDLATTGAFTVKSGKITFESVSDYGTKTYDYYFDDYGKKERLETFMEKELTDLLISDGQFLFSIDPTLKEKVAFKKKGGGVWRRFFPESAKKLENGKEGQDMTVAGKQCKSYSFGPEGEETLVAGWEGIQLYMKTKGSMGAEERATAIDTGAAVDPKLFEIGADYQVSEVD